MKRILKIIGVLLLVAVAGFGLLIGYVVGFKPSIDVVEARIQSTPERIERGRYLAVHVAQCIDCHSERDWSAFSGPVKSGTEGKGGEAFDQKIGFPGSYIAPNLTPHHLGNWSDGEVMRALTAGVSRDGHALFPVMPYTYYGKMDAEDAASIVAYIRTLKPVVHDPPQSSSDFPMSIIIRLIPKPAEFAPRPAVSDRVAYGRYLAGIAACAECHTPAKGGRINESELFSGGRVMQLPNGSAAISTNITPDETGIGSWTEEKFVEAFKKHEGKTTTLQPGQQQTLMPWTGYAGMTREDLTAIYAYLRSLKPIPSK